MKDYFVNGLTKGVVIKNRDYKYYAHNKSVGQASACQVEEAQTHIRYKRFAAEARRVFDRQDPDAQEAELGFT